MDLVVHGDERETGSPDPKRQKRQASSNYSKPRSFYEWNLVFAREAVKTNGVTDFGLRVGDPTEDGIDCDHKMLRHLQKLFVVDRTMNVTIPISLREALDEWFPDEVAPLQAKAIMYATNRLLTQTPDEVD